MCETFSRPVLSAQLPRLIVKTLSGESKERVFWPFKPGFSDGHSGTRNRFALWEVYQARVGRIVLFPLGGFRAEPVSQHVLDDTPGVRQPLARSPVLMSSAETYSSSPN